MSEREETQSLASAARQVARFRAALDWMIAHPDWEGNIALAILELGFKGQRQGIGSRKAALSLPLQQKAEALHLALRGDLPIPSQAEAMKLARLWGVTDFRPRPDLSKPSKKTWETLKSRTQIRLSARLASFKAAQQRLYLAHENLAIAGACQTCLRASQIDDAKQEGRLALLQAIDQIDPQKSFPVYASLWIKRRIRNFAMREKSPIKAPINLISRSLRGREDGCEALRTALLKGVVRLEDDIADSAIQIPHHSAHIDDERDHLDRALQSLTEKQREVVQLRFGLGQTDGGSTLSQIARKAGISRQQVFQREKRAMARLADELSALQAERG